jgi:carbohydrate-binding DOMON domain-containing protein
MTQNVIDGRRGRRFVPPYGLGEWVGLVGGIVVAVVVLALTGWNVVRLAEGETTVEALTCVDPTDSCKLSSD